MSEESVRADFKNFFSVDTDINVWTTQALSFSLISIVVNPD